jgi:ribosome biogenesis GTPase
MNNSIEKQNISQKEDEKIMEDLGYNSFFQTSRVELGLDDFSVARVINESKGAYKVKNADGEYLAKITGKIMFHANSREDYPAVGDWVAIKETDGGRAVIRGVLSRKTIMKRKYGDKDRQGEKNQTQVIATNIDVAYVVESVDRDYNLNRLERYFAIARDGGIEPVAILNKIDLLSKRELDLKLAEIRSRLGEVKIISTSTVNDEGLNELRDNIVKGKTYCFLGSSGVGKSSLINKLMREKNIKTGNVGLRSGRGKHVTTSREMYFLSGGGIVIDNPGVREVGMTDVNVGIDDIFHEIIDMAKKCKYADCTHMHEPGCEVLLALKTGKLDKNKYLNYTRVKRESHHYEMNETEKREKGRQFGKFIKKAKKELKEKRHKDF